MPPAAEPLGWQVLDKVRANLAAITAGSNYWYTPHLVQIVRGGQGEFSVDALDEGLGTWNPGQVGHDPAICYLVRRSSRHLTRNQTGTAAQGSRDRATMGVQVLVAQRFAPATRTETPTEALVVERMMADVVRALSFGDPGLGATIEGDDVFAADDGAIEEMQSNWAQGVVSFEVSYDYFSERP